jgi:hypothetical protein
MSLKWALYFEPLAPLSAMLLKIASGVGFHQGERPVIVGKEEE